MNSSYKALGITALVALIVGFCIGFVPEHIKASNQEDQIAALTKTGIGTQEQLTLKNLAIQAALVSSDAEQNNYSVAASGASGLFTGLRQYTDQTHNPRIQQQFEQILSARDRTIAALAQADPAVKPLLQDIFRKLKDIEANTK